MVSIMKNKNVERYEISKYLLFFLGKLYKYEEVCVVKFQDTISRTRVDAVHSKCFI